MLPETLLMPTNSYLAFISGSQAPHALRTSDMPYRATMARRVPQKGHWQIGRVTHAR
jgi:hypothetical protein